ncbi:hypothetical protein COD96_28640, partial [Bacillus thuringiensis]
TTIRVHSSKGCFFIWENTKYIQDPVSSRKNINKIKKIFQTIFLDKQIEEMNLGSAKGGNILAMLALILGMILTWITMIENALVIHKK